MARLLPRLGCASRAPARKSFRKPSSPSRLRWVTPCVPQPHGSALQGPLRLSPPPRGSRAGCLQPAVYLMNYVCPGPVNQGFCQRCWKRLSVSSLRIIPGLWLICGRSARGIRGGKPRAGFAQGFCLSKRLMPSPLCVHAPGSEGTVPYTGEARAGMQTHRRCRRSPGCRKPKSPLQRQSQQLCRALRDVAARRGLCVFYFFSRLLKYSDKSCRHGGTEQDRGGGTRGAAWRKAPAPAAGLSLRSGVLTN